MDIHNSDLWKHLVNNPRSVVFNSYSTSGSPGGLVKIDRWAPPPEFLISAGLGWGPQICISNKLPGDTDAAGSRTSLQESLSYTLNKLISL